MIPFAIDMHFQNGAIRTSALCPIGSRARFQGKLTPALKSSHASCRHASVNTVAKGAVRCEQVRWHNVVHVPVLARILWPLRPNVGHLQMCGYSYERKRIRGIVSFCANERKRPVATHGDRCYCGHAAARRSDTATRKPRS